MNRDDAEEYTQSLGQIVAGSWRQIAWADQQGIPDALGLTLREWVDRVGGSVRLPVNERQSASRELTAPPEDGGMGMSQREAAAVLGVDQKTISNDLRPVPEENSSRPPADLRLLPIPEENSSPKAHVANNSGDNDWYTPAPFTKAAAAVMGAIDLDPASSAEANAIIGATRFYTAADDGLTHPWHGRIWMNPPYAQPLIDRFCTRLAREYRDGTVTEACALVNNATETGWFQELLTAAAAVCLPRGRIRFWHPGKTSAAPLQGQAVIYLGQHIENFRAEFLRFGPVGNF